MSSIALVFGLLLATAAPPLQAGAATSNITPELGTLVVGGFRLIRPSTCMTSCMPAAWCWTTARPSSPWWSAICSACTAASAPRRGG